MFHSYFWIISVVIEIVFIVHAINRRQDYFWIFIILFFPLVGCAVYALMVWIPDARHSRTARGTSKAVLSLVDPRRELRNRLSHLDVSDTVENRVSLARELARHGMTQDALSLYERSLKGVYEDDPYLLQGYAGALFEAGMLQDARAALEKLRATNPTLKSQEAQLLYARVLDRLGETVLADKQYAAVVQAFGGMEAKCRYALFLKQQARKEEARDLFEDILRGAKHTSGHSRRLNKEWIGTAKRELA
ncbi:MAG TPA: tetratricopeptide repeat protein [Gammaproteobacteria bacterium]|nr:tetratricopeptide repeat protein [Gammaproteobacteria bacterium]